MDKTQERPRQDHAIPAGVAIAAHRGTSFVPEQRAAGVQADYDLMLEADRQALEGQARSDEQRAVLEAEWGRYIDGFHRRFLAYLGAKSRIVSTMIAGPSNFPSRQMEKRNRTERRRWKEFEEFRQRAMAAIGRKVRDAAPAEQVTSDEAGRLKRALAELIGHIEQDGRGEFPYCLPLFRSSAQGKLERAWKSEPEAVKAALAWGKAEAEKRGVTLFASRNRVWRLMDAQPEPEAEERERTGVEEIAEVEGARVYNDWDADRTRIEFDAKPDEATRTALRGAGWRWSPSAGVWQRKATNAAVWSARAILGVPE